VSQPAALHSDVRELMLLAGLQKLFWNENSPGDVGDQVTSEDPIALQEKLSALLMKHQTSQYDKKYYEGLEKAGFLALHEGAVHNQIFIHGGKRESHFCWLQNLTDGQLISFFSLQIILTSAQVGLFAEGRSRSNQTQQSPILMRQV
jgi:hypothetical protein